MILLHSMNTKPNPSAYAFCTIGNFFLPALKRSSLLTLFSLTGENVWIEVTPMNDSRFGCAVVAHQVSISKNFFSSPLKLSGQLSYRVFSCYKKFTTVIYHHSMVMPTRCVIKLHYLGNYCGIRVIYRGKKFNNIGPW